MPKFNTREEYEQWKAERLANPGAAPIAASQPQAAVTDEDTEGPDKAIKQAWAAGIASGVITLLVVIAAMSGFQFMDFSVWNLLDVGLIFLLSFGVYKKSRTAALFLLIYFIGSKILIFSEGGKLAGLGGAIIFGWFFLQGVRGTFAYKAAHASEEGAAAWRPVTIACGAALLLVALAYGDRLGLPFNFSSLSSPRVISAEDWKEFSSAEGRFSVNMPGQPAPGKQMIKTAIGDIAMYQFTLSLGKDYAYSALYSDFPELIMRQPNAAESLLNSGRDGAVQNVKGKLVSEQGLLLGSYPGREIHVEAPQGAIRARFFVVDQRLYQVIAVAPGDKILSDDVTKFLVSFKLAP